MTNTTARTVSQVADAIRAALGQSIGRPQIGRGLVWYWLGRLPTQTVVRKLTRKFGTPVGKPEDSKRRRYLFDVLGTPVTLYAGTQKHPASIEFSYMDLMSDSELRRKEKKEQPKRNAFDQAEELEALIWRRRALRRDLCKFVRDNRDILSQHKSLAVAGAGTEYWLGKMERGYFGTDIRDPQLVELARYVEARRVVE